MTPGGITRKIFSGIFFQENKSSVYPGFYSGVKQAGQAQSTGSGRQQGDTAGQAHTPRTAGRARQHAGQARQQRDEAGQGQATGNTGTEGTILNMRHTETSNCAIVLAWQESERGRARQGAPRPTSSQRETVERLSLLFCLQTPTRAGHPASAARLRYYPGPLRPAARGRPGSSPDMNKKFFPISLRLPQNPPGRRQKPWEII